MTDPEDKLCASHVEFFVLDRNLGKRAPRVLIVATIMVAIVMVVTIVTI